MAACNPIRGVSRVSVATRKRTSVKPVTPAEVMLIYQWQLPEAVQPISGIGVYPSQTKQTC